MAVQRCRAPQASQPSRPCPPEDDARRVDQGLPRHDLRRHRDEVEVEKRRKAFLRKWRLKCKAAADSLEEAGDRLFTFTRLDPSHWKSARTTNAIERLNEEFRRRVKTQTVLPCAETVPMLLWALMASGQIHPPGRLRRNRLPGDGCASSMAGKP